MARRHANAARASKIAHGERKRRYGGNLRIHVRHDAVSGQDGSRHLHEQLALVTRVTRNRNTRVLEIRIQVIGEALRGATDGIDIHAIRASAKRAAQARRAESQILEECVHRRRIVARVSRSLHFGQLDRKLLVRYVGNPTLQSNTHIAFFHFVSPNAKADCRIAIKAQPFAVSDVRLRKIPHEPNST